MAFLDEVVAKKELNAVVIVPQETVSSVSIFKNRGGYAVPMLADPDGELVEPLSLSSMPTHIIVDRKGIVTAVKSGVFIKEELFDMMIQ
jgi:peroxiredoxin